MTDEARTPEELGVQFDGANEQVIRRQIQAMRTTLREVAQQIRKDSRADIRAAGKFKGVWLSGLKVSAKTAKGVVSVRHILALATVFQGGKTIAGKPLLWIPLPGAETLGLTAKQYSARSVNMPTRRYNKMVRAGRATSALFYVKTPGGVNLLGSRETREFLYVGVPQITLMKRFHLREIGQFIGALVPEMMMKNFAAASGNDAGGGD